MNPITYRITLDLAKSGVQHVLSGFKVGDTNRRLEIRLTNDGVPYDIPKGTSAQICATFSNGTEFCDLCGINENVIHYSIKEELVCEEGELRVDFQLGNAVGEVFSTSEIILLVYPGVATLPGSEDQYRSVIQAVANAEESADRANTAADNAEVNAKSAKEAADSATNAAKMANTAAAHAEAKANDADDAAIFANEKGNYANAEAEKATNAARMANTATNNANVSANAANTATTAANKARDNANTAASEADTAADNANVEASKAKTATERANTAAENANTATTAANKATNSANAAATNANTAASNANTATSKVTAATNSANTAASNANTATTAANKATNNANIATERANTAAENANTVAEATEAIKNEVETKLANGEFNGASADDLSLLANALKGSASGNYIRFDDVSPLEHEMKVEVNRKNLFHYKDFITYYNATVDSSKPSAVNSGTENATYLGEECFSYKAWGTADTSNLFRMDGLKENTQYTFSFEMAMDQYKVGPLFVLHYTDDSNESITKTVYGDSFNKYSFTSAAGKTVKGFRVSRSDATTTVYVKKNMQIEEGTTATEYTPYIDMVEVKRCGKNFLPSNFEVQDSTLPENLQITDNGDGSFSIKGSTNDGNGYARLTKYITLPSGSYCFSGFPKDWNSSTKGYLLLGGKQIYNNSTVITLTEKKSVALAIVVLKETDYNDIIKPQIEVGTSATEWEYYKEPITCTADENGKVEGVTSLYPTTTLIADDGIILSAEYNKDMNKVVNDIYQKLSALSAALVNI